MRVHHRHHHPTPAKKTLPRLALLLLLLASSPSLCAQMSRASSSSSFSSPSYFSVADSNFQSDEGGESRQQHEQQQAPKTRERIFDTQEELPPIRIGILGSMVGDIGDILLSAIDGVQVALTEANAEGGIAGRRLEIVRLNTFDDETVAPSLVDAAMENVSTRFDVMALTPGRAHINALLPSLVKHDLALVCPVSGDRQDFGAFDRHLVVYSPIPDAEVEALIRYMVLVKGLRRIAVATTREGLFGNDMIPYITQLLAEFGLEIVYHFEIENPTRKFDTPTRDAVTQIMEARTVQPQALLLLGYLYEETGLFLSTYTIFNLDSYIGLPGLLFVLATMVYKQMPSGLLRDGLVITTQYSPTSVDTSFSLVRRMRAAVPNASADMTFDLARFDNDFALSSFLTSGYAVARSLIGVMKTIGFNGINRQSIRSELFSGRLMQVDDWQFGPLSDTPCSSLKGGSSSSSSAMLKRDASCECNVGARRVLIATMTAAMRLVPEGAVAFSRDTCIDSKSIQSPLIQLLPHPSTENTNLFASSSSGGGSSGGVQIPESAAASPHAAIAAAVSAFAAGDEAGYVNATVSPSSRTAIVKRFAFETLSQLEQVQRDMLLTVAVGGIYPSPTEIADAASNLTTVFDPLFITPRPVRHGGGGGGGFNARVIHMTATLEQEIHALAAASAVVGGGGLRIVTTDAASVDGLQNALTLSLNSFRRPSSGGGVTLINNKGSIASFLASPSSGAAVAAAAGGAVMFHGIQSADDIAAIYSFMTKFTSVTVVLPFHHVSLWYEALVTVFSSSASSSSLSSSRTEPDAVAALQSRLVFATNIPNWNSALVVDNDSNQQQQRQRARTFSSLFSSSSSPSSSSSSLIASNSALMRNYFTAMRERNDTTTPTTTTMTNPRSLCGFLAQRIVANIVERIPTQLTQDSFLSTLYAVSVVVVGPDAFTFGPLSNVPCGGIVPAGSCEVNVGARLVEVRSLFASISADIVIAPDQQTLGSFRFQSGVIDYIPLPPEKGMDTAIIIVVILGAIVFVSLLAAVLFGMFCVGRSHSNAPKDPALPFTIMFTDIQSSTSLWAEIPDVMGPALELHHKLIRALIKKHHGYEVKTIGDAFMIAFKSADDAVTLAYELQYDFYNCDDFPKAIDSAYLSFDREKMAEEAEAGEVGKTFSFGGGVDDEENYNHSETDHESPTVAAIVANNADKNNNNNNPLVNLTANLAPEVYSQLWSGLRVRVGIHTAFGDIKRDDVTKAFDYYGTVTNTAARVEAVCHGGQVCFTQDTLNELTRLTLITTFAEVPAVTTPETTKVVAAADETGGGGGGKGAGEGEEIELSEALPTSNGNDLLHANSNNNNKKDSKVKLSPPGPSVAFQMGQVDLRGLADRVTLFQLECIVGRVFPPLRLDAAGNDDALLDDGKYGADDDMDDYALFNSNNAALMMDDDGASRAGDNPSVVMSTPSSQLLSQQQFSFGKPQNNNTAANNNNNNNPPPTAAPANQLTTTTNNFNITVTASPAPQSLMQSQSDSFSVGGGGAGAGGGGGGMMMMGGLFLAASGNNNNISGQQNLRDRINAINNTNQHGGASSASCQSAAQIVSSIGTLFSVLPADKRLKEVKRLCEVWRVRIDPRAAQKTVSTWTAARLRLRFLNAMMMMPNNNNNHNSNSNVVTTSSTPIANNNNSNQQLLKPQHNANNNSNFAAAAARAQEEALSKCIALFVSKGDVMLAFYVDALAKRVKTVASKSLSTALNQLNLHHNNNNLNNSNRQQSSRNPSIVNPSVHNMSHFPSTTPQSPAAQNISIGLVQHHHPQQQQQQQIDNSRRRSDSRKGEPQEGGNGNDAVVKESYEVPAESISFHLQAKHPNANDLETGGGDVVSFNSNQLSPSSVGDKNKNI